MRIGTQTWLSDFRQDPFRYFSAFILSCHIEKIHRLDESISEVCYLFIEILNKLM